MPADCIRKLGTEGSEAATSESSNVECETWICEQCDLFSVWIMRVPTPERAQY